jgi:hypothetical protein
VNGNLLRDLYSAFDPYEALRPDDPRYVDCGVERGVTNRFESLARSIRLGARHSRSLVCGYRGTGKSTELVRFQELLSADPHPYFVLVCDLGEMLNLNDAQYAEVLWGIALRLLQDQVLRNLGVDPGKLWVMLEEIRSFHPLASSLAESDLSGLLRKDPDFRRNVRDHLDLNLSSFMDALNGFLESAEKTLQARDYRGLVLIVDSLDRVFREPLPPSGRTSMDSLFVDHAHLLASLACHVVYTIPPTLLHSPSGADLGSRYGGEVVILPAIPVTTRSGEPYKPGIRKLIEVVERRVTAVGLSLEKVFDSRATVHRACVASGGLLRGLLALVRTAITYGDALPVTSQAVEMAIRDARDQYIFSIHQPRQWQLLRGQEEIREFAHIEDSLQLVDGLAVLEYLDDQGPWFSAHPIAREASQTVARDAPIP